MDVSVKICGLNTASTVNAAVEGGAAYLGFVFYEISPRSITPKMLPALCQKVPKTVRKVGLFVNPSFEKIAAAVDTGFLDMIQLHGSETINMVKEVKKMFQLPVIKAVAISGLADVSEAKEYEICADMLLFDAKPPKGADRPGGNAQTFDWNLISEKKWVIPWMLAGGIDVKNLSSAIKQSRAALIDVSSGVENAPGVKCSNKILELLNAAASL